MSQGPDDRPDRTGQGRLPKNRARLLIVGTFVLILVVVFSYMLLVANSA
ncbi:hypothetical protein GCM10023328_03770 [Modestobacter marinus]|uniref:Uncharacterized protein n=1 Tax=Modestobacter marinus TaxID=477641 RepID=A0A846LXZ2_9ACTN|nr:hypothetical protein [Modestobacter marinus]NIH67200.1 hypothetical protein [Modestobacter marinus]GGL52837.1 hypothetical protein GCM10011589_06200 [Modestobacter marinus]